MKGKVQLYYYCVNELQGFILNYGRSESIFPNHNHWDSFNAFPVLRSLQLWNCQCLG